MERGEAGVTMTNKPVTFSLPSLCLFVVLLPPLAQSKAAVLSLRCCCDWGLVFVLSRKEYQGRFTSISHGSSLHLLSLSFLLFLSTFSFFKFVTALWFLVYVALSTHFTDSASSLIKQEAEGMATIALPSAFCLILITEERIRIRLFFSIIAVILSSL